MIALTRGPRILRCGVAVIACAGALLTAQTTMQLHVVRGESPHPSVVISDVHPGEATAIISGKLLPIAQASFWLENDSNRPIMGIATTWVVANSDGSIHTKRFTADSFLARDARPVVEGHHRLLVGPRIWVKEESMEQYARSPYFIRVQTPGLERIMEEFARAATVRVEIDSVIFADGEIVGSNKTGFDNEIIGRRAAANAVVGAIDRAGADPDARRSALLRIASERVTASDASVPWQHRFAQQLLRSRDFASVLDYLRNLPSVPVFHGSTHAPDQSNGLNNGSAPPGH